MMFEHFRKIHLVLLLLPLTLCLPADDGKNQPPPPQPAFHPGPPGFGNPRGAFFAKLTKEEREQVNRLAPEVCVGKVRKYTLRMLRLIKLVFVVGLMVPCVGDAIGIELKDAYSLIVIFAIILIAVWHEYKILLVIRSNRDNKK